MGVLEARKGKNDQAVAFFQTATSIAPHLFEPLFNQAKIADSVSLMSLFSRLFLFKGGLQYLMIIYLLFIFGQMGDLQNSYIIVQKALENYPDHADSKDLLKKLQKYFETM